MCPECQKLRQVLEDTQESERVLVQEVEGLRYLLGRSARAEVALKNQLTQAREDDPLSEDIKAVLQDWRVKTHHQKSKIPINGARAEKVRARLKNGFTVDQLLKANDGAAKFPYVVNAQRRPQGDKNQRFDDAELIFRNEKTVEKFMELADMDPPDTPAVNGNGDGPTPPTPITARRGPRRPVDTVCLTVLDSGGEWHAELAQPGYRRVYATGCPACQTLDPRGLLVCEVDNGSVFLHCQSGCDERQIVEAFGLSYQDLLPLERRAA